jgi:orotate phosphoribosyltransferase
VNRFPAAAAVAAQGGPVVVVVECGRTTRESLTRAAELLAQSGATVVGAIAICRERPGAHDLWS